MARKTYSTEASAVSQRAKRIELKVAGKCLWRCGKMAMKKPGGGRYILCKACRAKAKQGKAA